MDLIQKWFIFMNKPSIMDEHGENFYRKGEYNG